MMELGVRDVYDMTLIYRKSGVNGGRMTLDPGIGIKEGDRYVCTIRVHGTEAIGVCAGNVKVFGTSIGIYVKKDVGIPLEFGDVIDVHLELLDDPIARGQIEEED